MERYLNDRELAKLTGLAVQTLRNWRCKGRGPAYVKVGRRVIYPVDDVLRFMEARKIDPEAKGMEERG